MFLPNTNIKISANSNPFANIQIEVQTKEIPSGDQQPNQNHPPP